MSELKIKFESAQQYPAEEQSVDIRNNLSDIIEEESKLFLDFDLKKIRQFGTTGEMLQEFKRMIEEQNPDKEVDVDLELAAIFAGDTMLSFELRNSFFSKSFTQLIDSDWDFFSEKEKRILNAYRADRSTRNEQLSLPVLDKWMIKRFGFDMRSSKYLRRSILLQLYAPDIYDRYDRYQDIFTDFLLDRDEKEGVDVVNDKGNQGEIDQESLIDLVKLALNLRTESRNWQVIKKELEELHQSVPDYAEAIISSVGLLRSVKQLAVTGHRSIQSNRERGQSTCASYQIISSFFIRNADNSEALSEFWKSIRNIAKILNRDRQAKETIQAPVLSTVAVYKIAERLGWNPRLSTPFEDANYAIDLWLSDEIAVQIKMDMTSDKIRFKEAEESHIGQKSDYSQFCKKIMKYGKERNKKLRGYYITVPLKYMESESGEPNDKLLDFFRDKF